jgi:signal transduction histidine kinase/ActR/RegA family two-component response regulator
MLAVVCLLTAAVLIVVQQRMRTHVQEDLSVSLTAQSAVYSKIEEARHAQTAQSTALLAGLPNVKALMSTNDPVTVQDGSDSLLQTSGADLLILQNDAGEVLGFHAVSNSHFDDLSAAAAKPLLENSDSQRDWWFLGGHLFDVSLADITAGQGPSRHALGRVVLGRELSLQSFADAGSFGTSELLIQQQGKVVLGSFQRQTWGDFESGLAKGPAAPGLRNQLNSVTVSSERYVYSSVEFPGTHPIQLYSLHSYDQATGFLRSLNRTLLILGLAAVGLGALIVFLLSRQITRPLELLADGARHFAKDDFDFRLEAHGQDEVAELTRSFDQMRTSLKQSRDGMLRAARLEAVGRLAGGVAHDFNNLVMIIKGYSDILLASAGDEAKPMLDEIKAAAERATGLTRQLLAFSRKQVLDPQVVDANQSVQNMVKMLRVLIGADIELATNLTDGAHRIQVDPGQFEQVIMNLAVNARDAMPDGGKLILETKRCHLDESYVAEHSEVVPGAYVLLAVTDSGSGMTPEIREHIFEPFFTTKELGKGTGLGLATVYGIVKQSRGHISVYSEVGLGTTFKIYLPAVEKSVSVVAAESAATAHRGSETVLLAEDESALRSLAVQSLKRLGYNVLEAGDGAQALKVAGEFAGTIDVLITDMVMPKMGGLELAGKLLEKRPGTRIIFMSGYTEAATLDRARLEPDAILLSKPFSIETLASKIRDFQKKPAAMAASAG